MYTPISELVGKDISGLDYIWGMNFDQTIILVEHDLDNAGRFVVTYVEGGKEYQHDNVHPIREAFRDNTAELLDEIHQLHSALSPFVSSYKAYRKFVTTHGNISYADWFDLCCDYGALRDASEQAAALLASLDAGEAGDSEPSSNQS